MKIDLKFVVLFLFILLLNYWVGGVVFTSLYIIFISMVIIAIFLILLHSSMVKSELSLVKKRYEAHDTVELNVLIYNDSPFFLSEITIYDDYREIETRSVKGKSKVQSPYPYYFKKRGIYEFNRINYNLKDLFQIFTIKKKVKKTTINVYPKLLLDLNEDYLIGMGNEGISKSKSSLEDPYVTKEMRRYAPGDSLKRINWKVSAKQGELYVRLGEQSKGIDYLIVIDMNQSIYGLDDEGGLEENLISLALSVSRDLLTKNKEHEILINGPTRKEFHMRRMDHLEDVLDYMLQNDSKGKLPMEEFLSEKMEIFQSASSIVLFTGSKTSEVTNVLTRLKDRYNEITWFSSRQSGEIPVGLQDITLRNIEDAYE
ncbi:MAG: DUF58 domain-containing protein [Clostridium sp.]|nr:DUF58 domain-containing protein [Clostridium sp.]